MIDAGVSFVGCVCVYCVGRAGDGVSVSVVCVSAFIVSVCSSCTVSASGTQIFENAIQSGSISKCNSLKMHPCKPGLIVRKMVPCTAAKVIPKIRQTGLSIMCCARHILLSPPSPQHTSTPLHTHIHTHHTPFSKHLIVRIQIGSSANSLFLF